MASKQVLGRVPRFTATGRSPRTGGCDGYLELSYAELVSVFGRPNGRNDSYKTSTNWFIEEGATGGTLEVFDYKETVLYSRRMLTVAGFRRRPSYDWHVGVSRPGLLDDLAEYLSERLGRTVLAWHTSEQKPTLVPVMAPCDPAPADEMAGAGAHRCAG